MLLSLIVFLLTGVLSGLLLGMLGVGCGLVIVPVLAYWLPMHGVYPGIAMQIAITTSLLVITITSLSSLWTHHGNHNVCWDLVRRMWIGSVLGATMGAIVAHHLNTKTLTIIFGIFVLGMAVSMLLKLKKQVSESHPEILEPLNFPGKLGMLISASSIAFISSLVGIGGGTFTVPFLRRGNLPMIKAVATSTACGVAVSLAGAVTLMLAGRQITHLPAESTSYLYWPAFLGIGLSSVLFAPIGAKLAKRVNGLVLQGIFAGCLLLAGLKMLL